VVLSQDTSVQALDPSTGSRLWHRELFTPGLTGAGRFVFVGGTRADGSRTTLVLQAATGRRIGRLDAMTGQPIVAAGRVLWAEGSTIHIWR
jgi:outer membrane protein assembly factor BamB